MKPPGFCLAIAVHYGLRGKPMKLLQEQDASSLYQKSLLVRLFSYFAPRLLQDKLPQAAGS